MVCVVGVVAINSEVMSSEEDNKVVFSEENNIKTIVNQVNDVIDTPTAVGMATETVSTNNIQNVVNESTNRVVTPSTVVNNEQSIFTIESNDERSETSTVVFSEHISVSDVVVPPKNPVSISSNAKTEDRNSQLITFAFGAKVMNVQRKDLTDENIWDKVDEMWNGVYNEKEGDDAAVLDTKSIISDKSSSSEPRSVIMNVLLPSYVTSIKEEVMVSVKEEVSNLEIKVMKSVKEEVAKSVKEEVGKLKEEVMSSVNEVKEDVNGLKEDVNGIKKDVKGVNDKVDEILNLLKAEKGNK
jgi:hypothetical protein